MKHGLTLRLLALGWLLFASPRVLPAALEVSNRQPASDEWGYRPADGSVAIMNPPSWTWVHESAAVSYTLQWSPDDGFSKATTVSSIPWPTYTHNACLEPGQYHWRYRFTDKKGETSGWSKSRKTIVPRDAIAFPMPTRAEQKARVPESHPRLFMRPEDLPRLRQAAASTSSSEFQALKDSADRIIAAGPTPEPEHLGSARDKENDELVKYWWPNRQQTEEACREAETIAFVALITGDRKYNLAARQWVLHLASWDPDGPTNFQLNCEAGKPLLYRLPRAYDWAFHALNDQDRDKVRAAMQRRISDAWKSGEVQQGVGHLNRPYNSHGNRVWHKIGEAGIAFLGEVPEAQTWLDYAVNKFFACYPVWSDDDGGWHEGVSYLSGYMSKAVWWLQVQNSALQIDGLKKPFFAQVGDFPLYVAPPGSPTSGFGDLSYRPPSSGTGSFLDYITRAADSPGPNSHAPYWRWWAEQWHTSNQPGVLGFLYKANLSPPPPPKPPADLSPSKVFHGIGVASLQTTLLDSRDNVQLLFKSSPMGSQSHGHNPQNSFQLNAFGENLLTTCVYRDLHGSKFHYEWAHNTIAHNALLVDGKGQKKHTAEPQGLFVAESLTPSYDYIVGDATTAYEGRLTRCQRHVVLAKSTSLPSPIIVIFDDVLAKEPSTFQLLLHGPSPFQLDEPANTLRLAQPKAGVTAQYLPSSAELSFRQWDGYDPKPKRDFPNQWHVEASTREKSRQLEMITVIVPYRQDRQTPWKAQRIETPTALGVTVAIGGVEAKIAFRRNVDSKEPPVWQGQTFNGPVLVEP